MPELKLVLSQEKKTTFVATCRNGSNQIFFLVGCKDKLNAFKNLSKEHQLDKEKVCYAGDSEKDKTLLSYVKFSYVPADVDELVCNSAKTVLKNSRGQGVIKELAEKVLQISNKLS